MSAMEEKMASKEATEVKQSPHQTSMGASNSTSSPQRDQVVVPTVAALQEANISRQKLTNVFGSLWI